MPLTSKQTDSLGTDGCCVEQCADNDDKHSRMDNQKHDHNNTDDRNRNMK